MRLDLSERFLMTHKDARMSCAGGCPGDQSGLKGRSGIYWNCCGDPPMATRGRAVQETQALKLGLGRGR